MNDFIINEVKRYNTDKIMMQNDINSLLQIYEKNKNDIIILINMFDYVKSVSLHHIKQLNEMYEIIFDNYTDNCKLKAERLCIMNEFINMRKNINIKLNNIKKFINHSNLPIDIRYLIMKYLI